MAGAEWKKLKCVFCGYELATRADKPKCSKCGSRRLNPIQDFTALKPFKEVPNMAKKQKTETKIEEKKEEPKEEASEEAPSSQTKDADVWEESEPSDIDKDIWGDE